MQKTFDNILIHSPNWVGDTIMSIPALMILRKEFPELKSKLPTLWTRSRFISTVGSVSLDAIKKDIK